MKFLSFLTLTLVALPLLPSCGAGNASAISDQRDTISVKYAKYITLVEHPGYTEAKIINPWDSTKILHSYALVECDSLSPVFDENVTVINVPLEKAIIYSNVHNSLVAELGEIDAVAGICDREYISLPILLERINSETVADCGNSMQPNMERIMQVNPDAVLLSPFENSTGYDKFDRMNIPIVECADYMESSPLGRAEWMKFYGILFGQKEKADSIFNVTETQYLKLKNIAATAKSKPAVIFDRIYGNAWYVPEKYSTTGRLIEDAGGKNPFDFKTNAGSTAISPEEMLLKGGDADFWFIRYSNENLSYKILADDNPIYSQFNAFKNSKIYVTDTTLSHIFEDAAFHPQWLLANLISIIHPEISAVTSLNNYYTPLSAK